MVVLQSEDLETINSISNYPVQIVKQTKNGYGTALTEGINSVTTEYFCIFNADGSFDPAYLKDDSLTTRRYFFNEDERKNLLSLFLYYSQYF